MEAAREPLLQAPSDGADEAGTAEAAAAPAPGRPPQGGSGAGGGRWAPSPRRGGAGTPRTAVRTALATSATAAGNNPVLTLPPPGTSVAAGRAAGEAQAEQAPATPVAPPSSEGRGLPITAAPPAKSGGGSVEKDTELGGAQADSKPIRAALQPDMARWRMDRCLPSSQQLARGCGCFSALGAIRREVRSWWSIATSSSASTAARSARGAPPCGLPLVLQSIWFLSTAIAGSACVDLFEDSVLIMILLLAYFRPARRISLDVAAALVLAACQLVVAAGFALEFDGTFSMRRMSGLMLLSLAGFSDLALIALHLAYTTYLVLAFPLLQASTFFFTGLVFLLFSGVSNRQLATSALEMKLLLGSPGGGVLTIAFSEGGRAAHIREVEAGVAEALGFDGDGELDGKSVFDLVSKKERAMLERELRAFAEGGLPEVAFPDPPQEVDGEPSPPSLRSGRARLIVPFSEGADGLVRCWVRPRQAPRSISMLGLGERQSGSSPHFPTHLDDSSPSIGSHFFPTSGGESPATRRSAGGCSPAEGFDPLQAVGGPRRRDVGPQPGCSEIGIQTWIIWEKEGFKCLRCAKPPRPKASPMMERARVRPSSSGDSSSSGSSTGSTASSSNGVSGGRGGDGGGGSMGSMPEASAGPCILPQFGATKFECCWMSLLNSFKHWNVPQSVPVVAQRDCCSLHSWLFCARKILKYVQKHQACFDTLPYHGWQCQVCTAMNHQGSQMCGVCWRPQGAISADQPPGNGSAGAAGAVAAGGAGGAGGGLPTAAGGAVRASAPTSGGGGGPPKF
mmetsp:Transcript_75016/g.242649  ORF Transcript_75016/g.242649 Transcript_75016/m.242649 type:complete len:793 (-) Transcript_75016:13-2391(-)